MTPTGERPRVVIVGAGLGGTATAIRLLRFAREPLEIVLLERRPDYRYAGAAYYRDGNPWQHVFNIQAGRMSAFREDVDDFVNWANLEADRRDWPDEWARYQFADCGPAPRRIYPDYLADRLVAAAREANPGVVLHLVDGEAIDIHLRAGHLDVLWQGENDAKAVPAEQVVLATGLEVTQPAFASEVSAHEAFISEPYSSAGVRKLLALPPEATVVIVGSVLSAYDAAAFLLRRGHTGRVYLVSGSGSTLRAYPNNHQHGVVKLPPPSLQADQYEGRQEFIRRVRLEWEAACLRVRHEHPDMDPSIVTERVAKAWEPYIPSILERVPSAEVRGLLSEFGTTMATLRVGALEYTTRIVEEAMSADKALVELVVGRVSRIAADESRGLVVTIGRPGSERSINADLVISNFGRQPDYEKVDSQLWRNLLQRGLATPHRRTGRGLEVNEHGILLDSGGEASSPIWTVGVLREGDELIRNGRTGAFTFNLAAIKNHSIAVAAGVLERQETLYADPAAVATDYSVLMAGIGEEAARLFADAVDLEVRRMATKTRRDREAVEKSLDSCLRAILDLCSVATTHARIEGLRKSVNRKAVKKMTDVSVTPRQLRLMLGLTAEIQG